MTRYRAWFVAGVVALAVLAVVVSMRRTPSPEEDEEAGTDVAVHVGRITRATLHRFVTAYGNVEPEPAIDGRPPGSALIAPLVGGLLTEIHCVEGNRVSKGTVLFRLDSRVAEVALSKAQKDLEFAEKTYKRQQSLLTEDGTSQKTFQEAEQQLNMARVELSAAQTELALLELTAPLTGTVVRLNAVLGQSVEPNAVLAEIVDLNRLVVGAAVPSREASLLKIGQSVELGSGGSSVGTLTFIGKDIDPSTDTLSVRVSFPVEAGLTPGQFLEVRIITEEHRNCLVVPEDSFVSNVEEGSWIVTVRGDTAIRTPVEGGLREAGLVEVEGPGLKEGIVIVTEDAYSLPEETKIRIVEP
jgi:membrane fusion protein (multidrug efflux system)